MAIQITQGSVDELDLVEPLWLGLVAQHREVMADAMTFVDDAESWRRKRPKYRATLEEPESFLLLARLDDLPAPVGYLVATVERESTNGLYDLWPAIGDIDAVCVDPAHRGQGIGTALLEEAKRCLLDLGCTRWAVIVAEANTDAVRLYERLGFAAWERQLVAPLFPSTDAPA
ncbi:MAG: GNAT family N-acetyltransferase [Solirubrobacteraceae bacterium]|nr:GNAT family N-acetyltransferase [Solirubrobacteraceae bacterium]